MTHHFNNFWGDTFWSKRISPAGRVQSAMGAPRKVTLYNCFVSKTRRFHGVNCLVYKKGPETMRLGGGIGYDFSTLRPRGANGIDL